jgi:curli production assembly/transport component CsgG
MIRTLLAIFFATFLVGCANHAGINGYKEPVIADAPLQQKFEEIPPLDGPSITIAVYGFDDKTGQRKPSDNFSQLSSAVTQGSEVWVIQALQEVGNGTWFKVVERVGLDNLVKERQLIRSTREQYEGDQAQVLKPLLFAGLLIEGAVVGYDSNVVSGGSGARYLGIGAKTQYRVDTVTVAMRIISVSTGEVLLSVAVKKDIASHSSGVDVFKFLDLGTRAIEIESGMAINEPVNYAVRAAIEQAVCEIVEQGEAKGLWTYKLKDPKLIDQSIGSQINLHNERVNNEENNNSGSVVFDGNNR